MAATRLSDILIPPFGVALPPRWIEPGRVVIDDRLGPSALRELASHPNRAAGLAHRERILITSTIDRESAFDDRLRTDDLLLAFADEAKVRFERLDGACPDGCALQSVPFEPGGIAGLSGPPPPELGADGSLGIALNPLDLADAAVNGRVWYRRPPVQIVRLHGGLGEGTTVHDCVIHMRPTARWSHSTPPLRRCAGMSRRDDRSPPFSATPPPRRPFSLLPRILTRPPD